MQVCKCLKQVSDACLKIASSFVGQTVRHFSDTCSFFDAKTVAYGCLTNCLILSDRSRNVTVCLGGVSLDTPRPDTQTLEQENGVFNGT